MDELHEYKFISLLLDAHLDVVQTHFCSYVGPTTGSWLLVHPNTPLFCLPSFHFLITLHIHLGIPHPTIAHFSQCQCGHTINDLGIHLLHSPSKGECSVTHDTLRDIIATITLDSGAQV
jgi:hypothetical protein